MLINDFKKLKKFEKLEYCKEIIENKDTLNANLLLIDRINAQENIINTLIKEKDDLMYQIFKLSDYYKKSNENKVFKIEVSRILTFNEQHKANYSEKVKRVDYTEAFNLYKNEIFSKLIALQDDLFNSINTKDCDFKKVRLNIDFHVSNTNKDLDNIFKPFIDILFMFLNENCKNYSDNQINQIKTNRNKISGTINNSESIYFYFEKITEKEMIESDLSYLYQEQIDIDKKLYKEMIEFREFYSNLEEFMD